MYNDELMHYGVLGMKWGVRKKLKNSIIYNASKRSTNVNFKKSKRYENKAKKYATKAVKSKSKMMHNLNLIGMMINDVKSEKYRAKGEQALSTMLNNSNDRILYVRITK